jgi:A/G-specific adenine glycosylase
MTGKISNDLIKYFQDKLGKWFEKNGRKFPWRKAKLSNYQKVISEVLLQRTKAETVNAFFPQFIKDYPSWKTLAIAKQEEIEKYLKPLGLFKQRSPRLLGLAKEMVKRNGRFPKDREELESIPFVGQYIANAIMLLIHNDPQPLLDVNMARLLEKFFGPRKLADIRDDPYLQDLSMKVINHKNSKIINWAIIDFATAVCKKRKPSCDVCVLKNKCNYHTTRLKNQ